MVQHLSARCSQLPGDSYDTVAETDEEGGLSHRWRHPAPPSDRQRMAGSLRRIAMVGTALVLGVAAVYALRQTARSGLGESLLSAQQLMGIKAPQCLRDEEEFAGLCYMKCSLLTGGRAPFRVAASACCVNDNQFFCSLLQSQQAISNSLSVGGGAAIHNNPHAPGVGGICALVEEAYQGLCYPKCAALTDGKSAHRVGAFACCAGSRVECLNGKGTISTSPDFGGSVIPEAKDTGRSYKAINIMDARCDHDEDEFNGLCYTKCSELTYGKSTLRTGPGSCCNCGKGFFSGLCCMIPWNVVTDPSFTVGMSSNGEPSDPHPPGMRVKCSSEEEEFEGICYEKCSTLTKGQLPYRLSSVACCKFPGQAACHNLQNEVVNINLDKSQDLSNALPHAPYMRPETD